MARVGVTQAFWQKEGFTDAVESLHRAFEIQDVLGYEFEDPVIPVEMVHEGALDKPSVFQRDIPFARRTSRREQGVQAERNR